VASAVDTDDLFETAIVGYRITKLLEAAVRLDIGEHTTHPTDLGTLAAQVGATDRVLFERLVDALVALGVLRVGSDGVRLTPVGRSLLCDRDRRAQLMYVGTDSYDAWAGLDAALLSEGPPNTHDFYRRRAARTEGQRFFEGAQHMHGAKRSAALLRLTLAWDEITRVVDLGGGDGVVAEALVRGNPQMTATVLELPYLLQAPRAIRVEGGGEVRFEPGDFFECVPRGADLYLLSQILCNWDDEAAGLLIERTVSAMTPTSRLVVLEAAPPSPLFGALMSIELRLLMSGRLRSPDELESLLARGGARVLNTNRFVDIGVDAVVAARA